MFLNISELHFLMIAIRILSELQCQNEASNSISYCSRSRKLITKPLVKVQNSSSTRNTLQNLNA